MCKLVLIVIAIDVTLRLNCYSCVNLLLFITVVTLNREFEM